MKARRIYAVGSHIDEFYNKKEAIAFGHMTHKREKEFILHIGWDRGDDWIEFNEHKKIKVKPFLSY